MPWRRCPIEELAIRGAERLEQRAEQMVRSWEAARPRMIEGFREVGFGPIRTANFEEAIRRATFRPPDPGVWKENWLAKMRE